MAVPKRKSRSHAAQRRRKATTSEVIGPASTPSIDPRWEPYYRRLLELRAFLRGQKQHLKRDAMEEYTGMQREQADVATNTYDRDWALGMLSADQDALFEINEALHRIRDGTYGICQLTGKRIPKDRLDAIPWTRFTAVAERELERRGETPARRPKLGRRESLPRERRPRGFGIDT